MGTIAARYDASAEAYETWWAPVLRPSALRLIDRIDLPGAADLGAADLDASDARNVPDVRDGLDVLDVGAGSGTLAFDVARRWPAARVTLLDGSEAMLAVAEREADRLSPALRRRLSFTTGLADRLPFPDASFDVVVSSFVMQLVPHRPRALAEARRVLRLGGTLAYVTWLAGKDDGFAPDDAFFDALDDCEIPDELEPEEARSGDLPSVRAAVAQLRRAGFREVAAQGDVLVHAYDRSTYLDFLEQYAERETFELLGTALRDCVRARTSERLSELAPEAFVWRAPIVYVRGTRPAERRVRTR